MSWTLTMNSEGGSRGLLVSRATAWAVSVYCACSSRSRVLVAWMLPVLSSMTKMVPAPSPDRMYLMVPSPESTSEWSCLRKSRMDSYKDSLSWHGAWQGKSIPCPLKLDQVRCTLQWRKTDSRPNLVWTGAAPGPPFPFCADVCARTLDLKIQQITVNKNGFRREHLLFSSSTTFSCTIMMGDLSQQKVLLSDYILDPLDPEHYNIISMPLHPLLSPGCLRLWPLWSSAVLPLLVPNATLQRAETPTSSRKALRSPRPSRLINTTMVCALCC